MPSARSPLRLESGFWRKSRAERQDRFHKVFIQRFATASKAQELRTDLVVVEFYDRTGRDMNSVVTLRSPRRNG